MAHTFKHKCDPPQHVVKPKEILEKQILVELVERLWLVYKHLKILTEEIYANLICLEMGVNAIDAAWVSLCCELYKSIHTTKSK